MTALGQLRALETAGLIRLAAVQPDLEYTFRHALLQEAAYQTLSKFARATTHRAVAEALEALDPDTAHPGDLAFHFAQAGRWDKALDFAQRAGAREQAMYAPREALVHYDSALDAARRLQTDPPWSLLRARGQVLETLGRLDEARASFEQALAQARAAGNQRNEWHSLQDLGFLWSALDYARAGECFRSSLALARAMNDPSSLGHSLNRIGNWHLNNEDPEPALQYHREALAIFEQLGDRHSQAQTLDLLGLATALANNPAIDDYYPRAISLFAELGDRPGLISARTVYLLRTLTYETVALATTDLSLATIQREGAELLSLCRASGLRAAEAFLQGTLCIAYGPRGAYDLALAAGQAALAVAEAIQHRQWQASAHYSLGAVYADVLAWPLARQHLEAALDLAQQANTRIWVRIAGGLLAEVCATQYRSEGSAGAAWHHQPPSAWPPALARARAVVDLAQDAAAPIRTTSAVVVALGRGYLALACGDAAAALDLVERLEQFNQPPAGPPPSVPALRLLRAEALAALSRTADAVADLEAARDRAQAQGAAGALWRIQRRLGELYAEQGQPAAAEAARTAAQAIVADLAARLPAGELRENFLARASPV